MPAIIVNIQADDPRNKVGAKEVGQAIADLLSREIGDDVRVNASDIDSPTSSVQDFEVVNNTIRKPWLGMV